MGTKYNGALPPKYDNMTMWIDADNPKSFNPGGLYGDDYLVAGASQTATTAETAQYFIKYTHNTRDSYPSSTDTITGLKDISTAGHNYVTYEQYSQHQRVIGPVHGKWYFTIQDPDTINGYGMPNQQIPSGTDGSHHPQFDNAWLDTSSIWHGGTVSPDNTALSSGDKKFWHENYAGMDSNGLVNGHAITNFWCVIACGEITHTSEHDNKIWQIVINDNVVRSYSANLADATDIVPLAPGMIVDCGTTLGHWEIGPAISATARDYGAIYSFHPIRPAVYNTQFPHPKWSVDQFILAQVPIKPTGDGIVFYKTVEAAPGTVLINTTSSAADKFWWGRTTASSQNADFQLKFHPDATDVPAFDTTKYYYFYIYDEFGSLRVVTRKNSSAGGGDWETIKYHNKPHGALIVGKQYAIVVHEGLETAASNHWPPVKYPDISLGSRGLFQLNESFMRVGQDDSDDRIEFNDNSQGSGIVANYFTLNCWVRMTFNTDTTGSEWPSANNSTTNTNQNVDSQFGGSVEKTTIVESGGVFDLAIADTGRVEFTVHDQYGSPTVAQSELTQILSDGTVIDGQTNSLPGATILTNNKMIFKGTSYIGNRNRNWHMVSVTWHAYDDELKIYVDGELETYIKRKSGQVGFGFKGFGDDYSNSFGGRPVTLGQISRNSSLNNQFDSSMVDLNQFQMWANKYTNVVLSDDEIKQLYESSRQRFNK